MSDNEVQPTTEYIQGFEGGYQFALDYAAKEIEELEAKLGRTPFDLTRAILGLARSRARRRKLDMLLDRVATTIEARK